MNGREATDMVLDPGGVLCSVCREPTGIAVPLEVISPGVVWFCLCEFCRGAEAKQNGASEVTVERILSSSLRVANQLARVWPDRCEGSA